MESLQDSWATGNGQGDSVRRAFDFPWDRVLNSKRSWLRLAEDKASTHLRKEMVRGSQGFYLFLFKNRWKLSPDQGFGLSLGSLSGLQVIIQGLDPEPSIPSSPLTGSSDLAYDPVHTHANTSSRQQT